LSAQALKSAKTVAASPPFPRFSGKFSGEGGKPLLHLWAENCNVTRRVPAIADLSDSRMALAVERRQTRAPEDCPPHQQAGDLARYGYFPGVQLQLAPPWSICLRQPCAFTLPPMCFRNFLRPEMQVVRIGLAESRRRGLRVMMRQ
jgi:hypothetical protein